MMAAGSRPGLDKPRIAIIHPGLSVGGGSQACAVWLAMAAAPDFRVTLISSSEIDLERLDWYYGTGLAGREIATVTVPPAKWSEGFDALRGFRLERYCRKHSSGYDILVSTYNTMDFGKPGVQFIADLSFHDGLRRKFDAGPPGFKGIFYRRSMFRSVYMVLSRLLAGRSRAGWERNLTVSNSQWTRGVLERELSIGSEVIYPPVGGRFPDTPWPDREEGFLVLGRIEAEKRLESVLFILNKVRARGFDVHLHILGTSRDRSYSRDIETLCRDLGSWAVMEGLKGGEDKKSFIAAHKYGISGRSHEPFGIAVAEMIHAGCLVWVPGGGGQVEVVRNRALIFDSEDEAAEKIATVLGNVRKQEELRRELKGRTPEFSEDRFMEETRRLLGRWLVGSPPR
jgi:glycosyltransferase involved in cell wall biosynthesis